MLPQEAKMLSLVNALRAESNLAPLRMSKMLGATARHKSLDMANRDYFAHTNPDGITASQLRKDHGYVFNTVSGENIAAGNDTADETFEQWKNSPPHKENMLNSSYKMLGVGYAFNANAHYDYYWTQTFGGYADTNDFAVACGTTSTPSPTLSPTKAPLPLPPTLTPTAVPTSTPTATMNIPVYCEGTRNGTVFTVTCRDK